MYTSQRKKNTIFEKLTTKMNFGNKNVRDKGRF